MKSPFVLLFIFISTVSSSPIPSLLSAFDYITQHFSCFYVSAYLLNYTDGVFWMNQNKFLVPLTESITKTEDTLSLTTNDILISLVSSFRFKPNNTLYVIQFTDVMTQYTIETLVLSKKQEIGQININKIEISRPFISKKIDLMTALRFKEFQSDKDEQLYITLQKMLKGHIQDLLNEFNLNFQFQTILSNVIDDAGIVILPNLKYTVKNLSYEDAKYINKGNYIQVELYIYITFTKVEDHSIVTAKCNVINFKDKAFTIGTFEIIKAETGAPAAQLKEDFTSIVKEAAKKFYEEYN